MKARLGEVTKANSTVNRGSLLLLIVINTMNVNLHTHFVVLKYPHIILASEKCVCSLKFLCSITFLSQKKISYAS